MQSKFLDYYTDQAPSLQNTLDMFKGEWSSAVPGASSGGKAPLFSDPRASYWIRKTNEFFSGLNQSRSLNILELGPLEGAHSCMFSSAGWNVTSIESNSRAFLKTLIIYNEFNLSAKALYGDFIPYLHQVGTPVYDFIAASGVLYHMKNPIEAIDLISSKCLCVGIWTHFFEESLQERWPGRWDEVELEYGGYKYVGYKQYYVQPDNSFCGGGQEYSIWLRKETILDRLSYHGFQVEISSTEIDHPNGPCMTLHATSCKKLQKI